MMNNTAQYLQMMDLNGQAPTMQNISGQQGLYNQNMAAMKALGQQESSSKQGSPLQSLADALRAQQKPGLDLGKMRDAQGNILPNPSYATSGSVMANSSFNPYENLV
jgi:hypothetical protein